MDLNGVESCLVKGVGPLILFSLLSLFLARGIVVG
jgi:hypothetical protein